MFVHGESGLHDDEHKRAVIAIERLLTGIVAAALAVMLVSVTGVGIVIAL